MVKQFILIVILSYLSVHSECYTFDFDFFSHRKQHLHLLLPSPKSRQTRPPWKLDRGTIFFFSFSIWMALLESYQIPSRELRKISKSNLRLPTYISFHLFFISPDWNKRILEKIPLKAFENKGLFFIFQRLSPFNAQFLLQIMVVFNKDNYCQCFYIRSMAQIITSDKKFQLIIYMQKNVLLKPK